MRLAWNLKILMNVARFIGYRSGRHCLSNALNASLTASFFLMICKADLKLIAAGQPAGWPYAINGYVRSWYGNLSRDEALKMCRDQKSRILDVIGSKQECVE